MTEQYMSACVGVSSVQEGRNYFHTGWAIDRVCQVLIMNFKECVVKTSKLIYFSYVIFTSVSQKCDILVTFCCKWETRDSAPRQGLQLKFQTDVLDILVASTGVMNYRKAKMYSKCKIMSLSTACLHPNSNLLWQFSGYKPSKKESRRKQNSMRECETSSCDAPLLRDIFLSRES